MEQTAIPDLYSNSVKMSLSAYDVALTFALTDTETQESVPIVRIRMSPQHAYALKLLLEKHLEVYQDQIGNFELPDDLVRRLKDVQVIEEGSDDERDESEEV